VNIPADEPAWTVPGSLVIACAGLFLVPGALLTGAAYTQVGRVLLVYASPQGKVIMPGDPRLTAMLDVSKRRGFLDSTLAGLGLGNSSAYAAARLGVRCWPLPPSRSGGRGVPASRPGHSGVTGWR
jgi:hypothetical protein